MEILCPRLSLQRAQHFGLCQRHLGRFEPSHQGRKQGVKEALLNGCPGSECFPHEGRCSADIATPQGGACWKENSVGGGGQHVPCDRLPFSCIEDFKPWGRGVQRESLAVRPQYACVATRSRVTAIRTEEGPRRNPSSPRDAGPRHSRVSECRCR